MVSLVVATFNRVAELRRLLESLDLQTYKDFELIVVDQNPDDRLLPVLRRHASLNIIHVRSEIGVSKARNVGIRMAKGEVLSFPDDDCWYPVELLSKVIHWLESNPEFDGLFTATRDQNDKLQAPKFPPKPGPCTKRSVLRCAVAFNAFLRARVVRTIGFFREDIGPGTSSPYQSSEDIDYMIRPVERGMHCSMNRHSRFTTLISTTEFDSVAQPFTIRWGRAMSCVCMATLGFYSGTFLALSRWSCGQVDER